MTAFKFPDVPKAPTFVLDSVFEDRAARFLALGVGVDRRDDPVGEFGAQGDAGRQVPFARRAGHA